MLEGRYPAEFRRRQELTGPEGSPIQVAVDDLVSEVRSLRQAEPIQAAVVEGGSARVERLTTPGALPHVRGHLRLVGDHGRRIPTPWRGQRRRQLTLVGSPSPPRDVRRSERNLVIFLVLLWSALVLWIVGIGVIGVRDFDCGCHVPAPTQLP
jgi:hypothetical protein